MYAPRLCFFVVTTLATLASSAQAQGPWPTMNRPNFFSPVQEFFTPRYTNTDTYYNPPVYNQYPSTLINPGVPQCANGRCRPACPNGQCPSPWQTNYQPSNLGQWNSGSGGCANGTCGPNNYSSNGGCLNGQCGPRNLFSGGNRNYGTARPGMPNSSIGLRPLTPNYTAPRSGNLNRLIPLDNGAPMNGGYNAPQGPMYRDRESMIPQGQEYANDPGVRLQ